MKLLKKLWHKFQGDLLRTIRVSLKDRGYPIVIGALQKGLVFQLKKLGINHQTKILLVTSPNLIKVRHAQFVHRCLSRAGFSPSMIVIKDGEKFKNHSSIISLYHKALRAGLDRKSLVMALGGGVVTDLVGFFAATFMRGVRYVSLPTTLLGMVDAAIGGKTGLDLPQGKNLVGAFWQPSLVWIDPTFLKTLPEREWKTGLAEVVKYGVIRDPRFFKWLEVHVRRRPAVWRWPLSEIEKIIKVCAEIKATVVSRDEKETPLKGGREILNFGHTVGHALEAATGYSRITHGEAISMGMVVAGQLALQKGWWSMDAQLRLLFLLEALGLPTRATHLSPRQMKQFWVALAKDKKNIGGHLRFVLPIKIGVVRVCSGLPPQEVKKAAGF